jgi:hypothetical protein
MEYTPELILAASARVRRRLGHRVLLSSRPRERIELVESEGREPQPLGDARDLV